MKSVLVLVCCICLSSCMPLDTKEIKIEDVIIEPEINVDHKLSGQYRFFFETPTFKREEVRDDQGNVEGEYSFKDADGILQTYKYEAGVNGFKILEGPLPESVTDYNTPVVEPFEVMEQRRQHLDLVRRLTENPAALLPVELMQPIPLEYTPEVEEARQTFLKEYAAQLAFHMAHPFTEE